MQERLEANTMDQGNRGLGKKEGRPRGKNTQGSVGKIYLTSLKLQTKCIKTWAVVTCFEYFDSF